MPRFMTKEARRLWARPKPVPIKVVLAFDPGAAGEERGEETVARAIRPIGSARDLNLAPGRRFLVPAFRLAVSPGRPSIAAI